MMSLRDARRIEAKARRRWSRGVRKRYAFYVRHGFNAMTAYDSACAQYLARDESMLQRMRVEDCYEAAGKPVCQF